MKVDIGQPMSPGLNMSCQNHDMILDISVAVLSSNSKYVFRSLLRYIVVKLACTQQLICIYGLYQNVVAIYVSTKCKKSRRYISSTLIRIDQFHRRTYDDDQAFILSIIFSQNMIITKL